jgi:hypothetical protein
MNMREVRKIRDGEMSHEDMADFFKRRDAFLASVKNPVDILEYSPMVLRFVWTRDIEPEHLTTKRERATIKGRKIEQERARERAKAKVKAQ